MHVEASSARRHAEEHARAMVNGDLRRAGRDLTEEARAAAAEVMRRIPSPLSAADVTSADEVGDEVVVVIRYAGDDRAAVVESRWAEREGRPMITALRVI